MNTFQKQLSNFRHKQQFMYILVFSFAAVLAWIIGSLISSQKNTGISTDLLILARPLNPNIKIDVIEKLERKKFYSDSELQNFNIYKIIRSRDGKQESVVTIDTDDNALDPIVLPPTIEIAPPSDASASGSSESSSQSPAAPATQSGIPAI